jgi:hypothetical protein
LMRSGTRSRMRRQTLPIGESLQDTACSSRSVNSRSSLVTFHMCCAPYTPDRSWT